MVWLLFDSSFQNIKFHQCKDCCSWVIVGWSEISPLFVFHQCKVSKLNFICSISKIRWSITLLTRAREDSLHFTVSFVVSKQLPGVGTWMTGDIFLASPKETQVAVIVRTLTATGLVVYQGRKWARSHKCNRKYIETAKYDIAEEEIQFLVSSKPLQTKNAHCYL